MTAVYFSLAMGGLVWPTRGGAETIELFPTDDGFVRQNFATLCYGTAGALSVADASQHTGRFDTAIRFDTSAAADQFGALFGPGEWTLTSAVLHLREVGAPMNPVFSQGIGLFEVRWLSNDDWVEGTGFPFGPTIGMGNQLTWNLLPMLIATGIQTWLGTYSNAGLTMVHLLELALEPDLVADVDSGSPVTLHLLAASPTIGFVFNSGDYEASTAVHPRLVLTATGPMAVPGDLDGDADVDLTDYAQFAGCLGGPNVPAAVDCDAADLDGDTDVDLFDVGEFANQFTSA